MTTLKPATRALLIAAICTTVFTPLCMAEEAPRHSLRETVRYNLSAIHTELNSALSTLNAADLSPDQKREALKRDAQRMQRNLETASWGPYRALKPLCEARLHQLQTLLDRQDLAGASAYLSFQRRWINRLKEITQ